VTNVLVVAEHDGRTASSATARVSRCAAAIPNAEIAVAVFAAGGAAVAEQVAALDGVRSVLLVEDAAHAHPLAALVAPQLAELAGSHTHVLAPATTFGKDLLPRVHKEGDRYGFHCSPDHLFRVVCGRLARIVPG
jgi:electron transfer flavoprotein alpha subunit